jgi:hypothetical protein
MSHCLTDARLRGPWSAEQALAFLEAERSPIRIALTGESGFPLVVSLWYRVAEDAIWCATGADTLVARRLREDPRVGFEISVNDPPYMGVRAQARVELDPVQGPAQLEALITRYLGDTDSDLARWLLSRADNEVALRLRPHWLVSWDFEDRMKDAVRR